MTPAAGPLIRAGVGTVRADCPRLAKVQWENSLPDRFPNRSRRDQLHPVATQLLAVNKLVDSGFDPLNALADGFADLERFLRPVGDWTCLSVYGYS